MGDGEGRVEAAERPVSNPPIPRDFWREVPCGHPQDPVAALSQDGHWVCHCGWCLDENDSLDVIDGYRIVSCGKCGCYPGVPVKELLTQTTSPKSSPTSSSEKSESGGAGVDLDRQLAIFAVALHDIASLPEPLNNKNSALNQCDYLKSVARAALAAAGGGDRHE